MIEEKKYTVLGVEVPDIFMTKKIGDLSREEFDELDIFYKKIGRVNEDGSVNIGPDAAEKYHELDALNLRRHILLQS